MNRTETKAVYSARQLKRFAFTLIELLSVITTVAILASLLLPALARAKAKAVRTRCQNNQKQLMLAVQLYANDSHDYTPFPNWGSDRRIRGWVCTPPFTDQMTNLQTGVLWEYLKDYVIYRCPLDNTNSASWRRREQKYTTYAMNGALCAYQGNYPPHRYRIAQFRQDAIILWQGAEDEDFNDASDSPNDAVSTSHDRGTPVGCIDGHVDYVKIRDFEKMSRDFPGRLWCVPDSARGNGP